MKIYLTLFIATFWAVTVLADHPEIKIGVLTDLSGPVAYWGKQARIGAEIAAKEINENNGGRLKIIYGDHKLNTKFAVSEAQKLINIDKVDAIYSEFTPTSVAISSLVKNEQLLAIFSAAADSLANISENIFKTYLDYTVGCKMVANYWKKKGLQRIGLFKANLEFGELCLRGVKEVYPEVEVTEYNPGDNVSTQALLFKSKNIEGVINSTFEPELINMIKAMSSIGYFPEVGSNSDAFTLNAQKQFNEFAKKVYLFNFSPVSSTFLGKVSNFYPDNNLVSIEGAALVYTHIKQLYQVLTICSNRDLACQVNELSSSLSDKTIGFERWENRRAIFNLGIYQRSGDGLASVDY